MFFPLSFAESVIYEKEIFLFTIRSHAAKVFDGGRHCAPVCDDDDVVEGVEHWKGRGPKSQVDDRRSARTHTYTHKHIHVFTEHVYARMNNQCRGAYHCDAL